MSSLPARADFLTATNGEKFVGQLLEEGTNTIVFESELGGRLTVPRTMIRSLERTPPPKAPGGVTSSGPGSNLVDVTFSQTQTWRPPGVGKDGFDWIQLKSGEWLKGDIKYVQEKEVEFDSDQLDELTLKLSDVRQLYTARPMFAKSFDREIMYGTIVISNEQVLVKGPQSIEFNRDELTGIAVGGQRERDFWSGYLNVGLSLQSGNSSQTTVTSMAELARRTPATVLLIDYLGNYTEVNNVQSANNDRVNLVYDIRLDRHWFLRAAQLEYYRDPLANISSRLTGGVAAGYYIFDRDGLEWNVAAGPSYQYTRFNTVTAGDPETAQTPAAVFQSNFKMDFTSRLTFIQTFAATVTDKSAGEYTHHSVSTLEFEIKRHLNLDVSYIWDYLMYPQAKADGITPKKNDYYLTVGLGIRF